MASIGEQSNQKPYPSGGSETAFRFGDEPCSISFWWEFA